MTPMAGHSKHRDSSEHPRLHSLPARRGRTGGEITVDRPIVYPTLGLANKAGEVAGKVKKIFRDRGATSPTRDREGLALELGDAQGVLRGGGDRR